jgi:uncharacterized membrane protein (GlpM family)
MMKPLVSLVNQGLFYMQIVCLSEYSIFLSNVFNFSREFTLTKTKVNTVVRTTTISKSKLRCCCLFAAYDIFVFFIELKKLLIFTEKQLNNCY